MPVREEAIPVRFDGGVVAVLARDTNLATARSPSPLELAYLRSSGDLAQMVSEGGFPFRGGRHELVDAPRVGDGVMRVNAVGEVVYASPNALSAYRRIGYTGNVTGEYLQSVHAMLRQGTDRASGRNRIWDAVTTRQTGRGRDGRRGSRGDCCARSRCCRVVGWPARWCSYGTSPSCAVARNSC